MNRVVLFIRKTATGLGLDKLLVGQHEKTFFIYFTFSPVSLCFMYFEKAVIC